MRMLNSSELEVVSGGLIANPDGATNSSGPLANGPLAKYLYLFTGGSASGADDVGVNESEAGAGLEEVLVTAPREVVTVQEVLQWASMICAVAAAVYAAPLLVSGAGATAAAAWAYGLASAGFGAIAAYLDYIDGKR